ncbi:retrovirus-related pol polyprotein from transposon TNT 1-94 [Tanacetum coccineum]
MKHWEELICENVFGLGGHWDHLLACLAHMLYCIVAEEQYNLSYFFAKRISYGTLLENGENGRMTLNSVQNGLLIWLTVTNADGFPPDVYAIVNHHKVAKEIWDRVKLLMQGMKLSSQEKECKLYDEFDKFTFVKGDDPITCLNKAMAFLTLVASSRFPSTNNQLRTSSNLRNQAIIQDDRVTGGNNKGGQARVVKCYNCQGKGHMARQCTQPKRPRNASWYSRGSSVQTTIPNTDAFQTEDLDAYDFDCDDVSNAKAVLMANLSSYGSYVLLEYLQETQLAAVQDTNLYEQHDSMILSVIEQMSKQMINHVNNWEKANQEKNNESVTAELERYKERVKTFKQRLNVDLSTLFKRESKEKENKYIDKEIDLEKNIKELDNIVYEVGQSAQTVHMLTKPQVFYDNAHKQALGYQNPFYLKKAQRIKPTLYDGSVISDKHVQSCEYFENKDLKAQLQAKDTTICKLKEHLKMMRENEKEEKVKHEMDEIETINIKLEHKHGDSLIAQLNSKSMENADLKHQLQDKVFVITSLKNDLRKLKGKETVENAAQIPIATTIASSMFKLDLDYLAPRLLQNREAHIHYLKHTQEQTDILRGIDHSQELCHLKETTSNSVETPKPEIKVYSRRPKQIKSLGSSKNAKIVESKIDNNSKPNHLWGSNATDVPSSSSLVNDRLSRLFSGKRKKSSHQPKAEDTNQEKLYLLHMDLCGLMRVESINGKKYILNSIVERRNHTLVEAAHTMLIFSKALLFLWAEAIKTACYTQNRSLIRLCYNKTPYEMMHDKKLDLSFLHVFGSIYYPTNDSNDLGKLNAKADIGIFVGYAPAKKAFRIYNRRTHKIMETIHVTFYDLTAMASEQFGSGLGLQSMTPATTSSGLVPNPIPQQPCISPNRDDWDRLFQPIFDEYFNPPTIAVSPVPVAAAPRAVDTTESPVSTLIDLDAPSTNTPMAEKNKLDKDLQGTPVDATLYRGMIVSLMCLTSSRPDLIYAVCLCAQYQAKPTEKHLNAVTRIFQYLREPLTWVAGTRRIPDSSVLRQQKWIVLCCNNVHHSRAKHIDVRYHFIKEQVEKGIVKLYFVQTEYQLADIFTKPLPRERFNFLIEKLGMRSMCLEMLKRLTEEEKE